MEIPYLILAAILVSLVLVQVNQRVASPVLAIADRWLRWGVFAFGAAQACVDFQLVDRPYWVLVTVFFLFWFLGETLLNWISIYALSVSPLPLFPRYAANLGGDAAATLALGAAQDCATTILYDLHQFMGAMGLTLEHPLYRWTYRVKLLVSELGGPSRQLRDLAAQTWPGQAA